MATLRENLLVRFSVLSFVIMLVLAVGIGLSLLANVKHGMGLLASHGDAMMSGIMIMPEDHISIPNIARELQQLQLRTLGALVGGLFVLYSASLYVVWRGWLVIRRQQHDLQSSNQLLDNTNVRLAQTLNQLRQAQQGGYSARAFEGPR